MGDRRTLQIVAAIANRLATRPNLLAGVIAALAGVVVLAVATVVFPYHSINHDEAVYLTQAAMLLDGRLVLHPPVSPAFRPWFFVESANGFYPKYAPVPALLFAIGVAVGHPRLSLGLIGATVIAGIYAVTVEAFDLDIDASEQLSVADSQPTDTTKAGRPPATWGSGRITDRRTGLLAALLAAGSPLYLVETSVFLPYAPTTALNLLFAAAYLRAHRLDAAAETGSTTVPTTGVRRWAAMAGIASGTAFFARPFTAVLFVTPFTVHALWSLIAGTGWINRRAMYRLWPTVAFGILGVVVALGYNWLLTGDPTLFPYEAFAPQDGLGFGQRRILDYSRTYTPILAIRANALVLLSLATRWSVAGPIGIGLAAIGLGALLHRIIGRVPPTGDTLADDGEPVRSDSQPAGADDRPLKQGQGRRVVIAGIFLSVIAGNLLFWGNLNILGTLTRPDDGLIHFLGPYYHYDLLLPLSAFGARGVLLIVASIRESLPKVIASMPRCSVEHGMTVATVVIVVGATVLTGAAVGFATQPVADNRAISDRLQTAYTPFDEREFDNALVFLPTPYGDWLHHPFQALRNEPNYGGSVVYALERRPFDVVAAYPDRTYYRYVYRGRWSPVTERVEAARLQRVEHVQGPRVTLSTSFGIPSDAQRISVRLASRNRTHGADSSEPSEVAYFGLSTQAESVRLNLTMANGEARLDGNTLEPVDGRSVPIARRGTIRLHVNIDFGGAAAMTYLLRIPVASAGGEVRALTPSIEVCRSPRRCGGEAAYVPGEHRSGVHVSTQFDVADAG